MFYTYYGFKKHILGVHRDCVASGTAENVGSGINVPVSDTLTEDPPVTFQTPVENRQLMDMCSAIVAQVQAAGVSENTVQCLVGSMEELVSDVHAQARDTVLKCLSSEVPGQTLDKVNECFHQLENPFSCLNTETKRQRHFEKKWKIVEPVEYVLGVR